MCIFGLGASLAAGPQKDGGGAHTPSVPVNPGVRECRWVCYMVACCLLLTVIKRRRRDQFNFGSSPLRLVSEHRSYLPV